MVRAKRERSVTCQCICSYLSLLLHNHKVVRLHQKYSAINKGKYKDADNAPFGLVCIKTMRVISYDPGSWRDLTALISHFSKFLKARVRAGAENESIGHL